MEFRALAFAARRAARRQIGKPWSVRRPPSARRGRPRYRGYSTVLRREWVRNSVCTTGPIRRERRYQRWLFRILLFVSIVPELVVHVLIVKVLPELLRTSG